MPFPLFNTIIYLTFLGITIGAIYALVGVGLTLILGVGRLVNFAHGEFYMLGAYVTYFLIEILNLSFFLTIPLVTMILAAFGIVAEKLTIHPLRYRDRETWILASLGLSILLRNLILVIFSPEPRRVRVENLSRVIEIFGIRISILRILILLITLIIFFVLNYFINRTRLGRAMRAVAQNREAATTVGIDVDRINSITYAIGVGLSGIAGSMIVPLYLASPTMGQGLLLKAFMIVIVGGIGNVMGAIYSGFILGISENFVVYFIGPEYRDVISFLLLIIILGFKPAGVFGKNEE